jgi:hypothetical protein
LIEESSFSLIEINSAAYKAFKLALGGHLSESCTLLALFLREQQLIKISVLIMNRSDALKQAF